MKNALLLSLLCSLLSFPVFAQYNNVAKVKMLNKHKTINNRQFPIVLKGYIYTDTDTSIFFNPAKRKLIGGYSMKYPEQDPIVLPISQIKEVRIMLPEDRARKRGITGGILGGAVTGLLAGIVGYQSGFAEGDDRDTHDTAAFISYTIKGKSAKRKGWQKASRYGINGLLLGGITGALIGYYITPAMVTIPINGKKENYKDLVNKLY